MKLIIVAGLNNSGPGHWQNFWLDHFPDSIKVEQDDWDNPVLVKWLAAMDRTIKATDSKSEYIIVAHSLGTILTTHYIKQFQPGNIVGIFLVAPADVDSPEHTPEMIWHFGPIATERLPVPSILIASENDPYMTIDRSQELAQNWGSEFYNFGKMGHINSTMNLGMWPEGQQILQKLIDQINKQNL